MIELINTANAQALRKSDALLASLYADQDRRLIESMMSRPEWIRELARKACIRNDKAMRKLADH
jgi:hypothetical protein